MFQFQNTSDMLPSELMDYISQLEHEIRQQETAMANLGKADVFQDAVSGEAYDSEQELMDSMELGDVIQARGYKKLKETFKVKISSDRIDDYDDRFKAEHARMLHGL